MMKSDTAHGMSCKTLLISLVLLLTAAGLTAQTGEESQERLKSIEIAYTDYTEGIDASYDDAGRMKRLATSMSIEEEIYVDMEYSKGNAPAEIRIIKGGEYDSYTETQAYEYVNKNRISTVNVTSGAEAEYNIFNIKEKYSYDEKGRISLIKWSDEDTDGRQTFSYSEGLIQEVTIAYSASDDYSGISLFRMNYNSDGQISSVTETESSSYSSSEEHYSYSFEYDSQNRLIRILKSDEDSSVESTEISYTPSGEVEKIAYSESGSDDPDYTLIFHYEEGKPHYPVRQYMEYFDPICGVLPEEVKNIWTLMYLIKAY